jgi:hypothetical protein
MNHNIAQDLVTLVLQVLLRDLYSSSNIIRIISQEEERAQVIGGETKGKEAARKTKT